MLMEIVGERVAEAYNPKLVLSPLEYQRHAERTKTLSMNELMEMCAHHLRCSHTVTEGCNTHIALFKGLTGKLRLLLDLNYLDKSVVMTAMPSVSKNLKGICE